MFCYDRLSRLRQSGSNILTCLPFFLNCEDTDDVKIDLLLDWVYSFYVVVSFNAVVFSLFFKLFYKGINFWALCWYKCVHVCMRVHTCVRVYVCVRWKWREKLRLDRFWSFYWIIQKENENWYLLNHYYVPGSVPDFLLMLFFLILTRTPILYMNNQRLREVN